MSVPAMPRVDGSGSIMSGEIGSWCWWGGGFYFGGGGFSLRRHRTFLPSGIWDNETLFS